MSAVFDNSRFGERSEPYWWTENWTDEQKRSAGDPRNRIEHAKRTKKRMDEADPDNVFGPEVGR